MTRAAFRQADMERIFRAAKSQGMAVQIDIRSLVVTAIPDIHKVELVDATDGGQRILPVGNLAPDGEENFED
ncbi:hypothetical protein [Rhizobium mongolense]|uniref:hypothetical protein n=1 Tax=Rhizobium mongolense TaxID=57676 RepID=UPI0034A23A07